MPWVKDQAAVGCSKSEINYVQRFGGDALCAGYERRRETHTLLLRILATVLMDVALNHIVR